MPGDEIIKCLSIRQPYADDVFFGGKWAENRSWATSYRGELWIHSSGTDDSLEFDPASSPTGFLTGHILGRVQLVRCVKRLDLLSAAPESALKLLDCKSPGNSGNDVDFCKLLLQRLDDSTWLHVGTSEYIWILAEPEMLDQPIRVSGALRIWEHQVQTERLGMATGRKKKWKGEAV